jgi:putative protease
VQSPEPLPAARNQSLTPEFAREQLGRLGNTPYELADLTLELNGRPFAPASLLNNLRRDAVEQLQTQQAAPPNSEIHDSQRPFSPPPPNHSPFTIHHSPFSPPSTSSSAPRTSSSAALDLQPASITLDYLDLYGLRPAVEQVQAAGIEARVASPRILKPNEQRIVNFLLRLDCAILVRSTGLLHALQGQSEQPLIGDFSLNAANAHRPDLF